MKMGRCWSCRSRARSRFFVGPSLLWEQLYYPCHSSPPLSGHREQARSHRGKIKIPPTPLFNCGSGPARDEAGTAKPRLYSPTTAIAGKPVPTRINSPPPRSLKPPIFAAQRHNTAGFSSLCWPLQWAASGQSPVALAREASQSELVCKLLVAQSVQQWAANVRHAEERLWTSTFMWQ